MVYSSSCHSRPVWLVFCQWVQHTWKYHLPCLAEENSYRFGMTWVPCILGWKTDLTYYILKSHKDPPSTLLSILSCPFNSFLNKTDCLTEDYSKSRGHAVPVYNTQPSQINAYSSFTQFDQQWLPFCIPVVPCWPNLAECDMNMKNHFKMHFCIFY